MESDRHRVHPTRVATWNLWWRFGPWQQRRDAITAVLAHAQPDVCGLQEVWASPSDHHAKLLADRLGMHWTWTPSPAPQRWPERIGDPAIRRRHRGNPAPASTMSWSGCPRPVVQARSGRPG